MKIYLIGFVLFLYNLSSLAISIDLFTSSNIPDSLLVVFKKAKDDKSKIDGLNDICFYLADREPLPTIPKARKIIFWADSIHYTQGIFDATNNLGILFYRTYQYVQAMSCFESCVTIADEMKDNGRKAAAISNMALVYNDLAQYFRAIELHQQALRIREKRKDTLAVAVSLNNLGMTYHSKGDWNIAISYYLKAIHLLTSSNYKNSLANTFNNLGLLYFSCYNDTTPWVADSAEYYFMKAYSNYLNEDNKWGLIKALINLGNLYAATTQYEKALDAYRAALNQQRLMSDSAGMALTLYNMAIFYDETGDVVKSKNYLLQSISMAERFKQYELCRDIYKQLFLISKEKNNISEAVLFASKFININDSLNEISKTILINQFQGKFNFQYIENNKISVQNKKWKYISIASAFLALLAILLFILKKNKTEH